MIKIIDLDNLFDKYIQGYVYQNIGKVKPEEIENQIPVLYEKFGNESLTELNGKTPNTYYTEFSTKELLKALLAHVESGVSVSDYLIEALVDKKDCEEEVATEILKENKEEFTAYLMNILNDKKSKLALSRYLEFVLYDYSEPIRELAIELLTQYADQVKEQVLVAYNEQTEEKREYLTEILSGASKDDRVFNILINEFVKNRNKVPLYAGYLAKYGDERALPFLLKVIEEDKISYADFEELRFAIEALGGEYNKERDFSYDKFFKKIKNKN